MGKVSGGFVESGDHKIAIVDNVPIADGVPNRHCRHWRSTMDALVTISMATMALFNGDTLLV